MSESPSVMSIDLKGLLERVEGASSVPGCAICGEWDFSPSVECFEVLDQLVCEDCADDALEDNGQFGVGA